MDILIGIALNLKIALGSLIILTILILPIQEYRLPFHFFELSSVSFINVLQFSVQAFHFLQLSLFLYILFFLTQLILFNTSLLETKFDSFSSVQFSSVAQLCPTLCDPMNRSTPGLPVHHQPPEFTQIHVHQVSDAIQPSHPLSSPSPPAPNPSQHHCRW